MNDIQLDVIRIMIMAVVTFGLRVAPFLLFPEGKRVPPIITRLGTVLPCAVMGMLIVYCVKHVSIITWPHGIPETIGIVCVVGLHLWKRNVLLSILGGTILYVLMVQFVFS